MGNASWRSFLPLKHLSLPPQSKFVEPSVKLLHEHVAEHRVRRAQRAAYAEAEVPAGRRQQVPGISFAIVRGVSSTGANHMIGADRESNVSFYYDSCQN